MFGNRKMHKCGLEDTKHAYEGFSEKQKEVLEQLRRDMKSGNKKIEDALAGLGDDLNGIHQYLDSREKAALYHLETSMDIKALGESEQRLLVAMLYQLANDEGTRFTENQRVFIRSVQRYLEITNPQMNVDLSVVGDIDSLDVQKAFLRVSLEFFYLQEEEEITEEQEEFLNNFSVNKKQATAIENSVSRLYNAVGAEGITEKYGYVPDELGSENAFVEAEIRTTVSDDENMDYGENFNLVNLEDLMLYGTLHVKKGEKSIYRNKNIHFLANVLCEGELIFESCVIHYGENNSTGGIEITGSASLTMWQCTIEAHSYMQKAFIEEYGVREEIEEEDELTENCNTSDLINIQFSQCKFLNCVVFLQTGKSVLLDCCYIVNPWEFMLLDNYNNDVKGIIRDCKFLLKNRPVFLPENVVTKEAFVIHAISLHFINSFVQGDIQISTIEDCVRENAKKAKDWSYAGFLQVQYFMVDHSSFKGIRRILDRDNNWIGEGTVRMSTFEQCYDILSNGEFLVEECRFDLCSKVGNLIQYDTQFLYCQFNDCFCELIRNDEKHGRIKIDCCEFNNWSAIRRKKDNDSGMLILNGVKGELNEVTNCTFNGIQAYQYFLIRSYNNKSISNDVRTKVRYCIFLNCKTEREDDELIKEHISYTGLFNRIVTYRIVDIDDCQGLDQVNDSGNHNDNVLIKNKSSSGEPIGVLGHDNEKSIDKQAEEIEKEKLIEHEERFFSEMKEAGKITGEEIGGIVYGNVSNASTIYGNDKFSTPRGHGFAAEQANHLYDKITNVDFFGQNKVQMVGEDIDPQTGRIIKNGADRIVNGTNIQTKYCKSGGKCISECFDNGKFRYLNSDGTPMQIEVPSDKYDAAVHAMENRIKNGEIPGVTDPKEAKNIVRRGHFTYEQAKNIAKAGTVESITFDAVNGAIIATSAFGISTVLSFATSVWNGEEFDVAIKNATYTGLRVGGTTFITAVLSSQLTKTGLNSMLVGSSEAIVSIMGPKASAMLVNAFRSGTNIYGAAAMKSAAKMLRGNAITGTVSVVVLSSVDVVNIFRGRISGKQLFKNVANTASTVAGGTAGWVGGATAGAAIGSAVPVIGTAIGGIVGGVLGSFAGGAASSTVSNAVLGAFIEDDAEEMTNIIEKVFQEMATDYLLNQKEAENIIDKLKDEMSGGTLKDMFASSDRKKFARDLLIGHVENETKKRKKIVMPSETEMQKSLRKVLEEMADKANASMQTVTV